MGDRVRADQQRGGDTVSEWISVEDRLPEKCGHYLVYIQGGDVYNIRLARYSPEKNKWRTAEAYSYFEGITHWMPLPEPPREVSDDGKA